MSRIKTTQEIELLREGGRYLSNILYTISEHVAPGKNIRELDREAHELILSVGGKPAFLDYKASFSTTRFPATLCVSVNEEVVHGFGSRDRVLNDGDIVALDIGMEYKGLFTDMAVSLPVGKISPVDRKLLEVTRKALYLGISIIKPGLNLAEFGRQIQNYVEKQGFSVVRSLVGHGVGHRVHEDPAVPNYFDPYFKKEVLEEGMVLALEPMVNIGTPEVETAPDDWTILTQDRSRSAHFEHTIAVTKNGAEVLTEYENTPWD